MPNWGQRRNPNNQLERFMSFVKVEDRGYRTLCWVWHGPVTPQGYGRFSTGYRVPHSHTMAHKWLYEEVKEPIEDARYRPRKGEKVTGLTDLDHLCLVKLCVNLQHLELITRVENNERKHGRVYRNKGRPLTPEHVEAIRKAKAAR